MKQLISFSVVLVVGFFLPDVSHAIQKGDMAGAGVNSAANGATGAELAKDAAACKKYKACSNQPPPKGPQCQQKAKHHCSRAGQEAAQQGNLGKGMGDLMKNLMSALAQGAQPKGGGDTGFGANGFVNDVPTALNNLENVAGLSAGEARNYIKNNLKAKEFLDSDLGKSSAASAGVGGGAGAAIAGGTGGDFAPSGGGEGTEGSNASSEGGKAEGTKVAALTVGGAGGGGGGTGGGGDLPPLDDLALDPLPPLEGEGGLGGKLDEGLSGDFSTIAGEKIGVPEDNIFQMLSRRYQYRRLANGFLSN